MHTPRNVRISPSQIETFSESSPFGCKRKWHFQYIKRLPSPQLPSAVLGEEVHKLNEEVLLGTKYEGLIVSGEARMIHAAMLPLVEQVKSLGISAVEKKIEFELAELQGIIFNGRVDVITGSTMSNPTGIFDWKTTSDINKYGKNHHELLANPQLLTYARWAFLEYPQPTELQVALVYGQTRSPYKNKAVSNIFTRDATIASFSRIVVPVAKEIRAAYDTPLEELPKVNSYFKCKMCPYKNECEGQSMSSMLDILKAANAKPAEPKNPFTPPEITQADRSTPVKDFLEVADISKLDEAVLGDNLAQAKKGKAKKGKPEVNLTITETTSVAKVEVTVSHGLTINLGQFNSARVDITCRRTGDDFKTLAGELEEEIREELERQLTTYKSLASKQ